MKRTSDPVISIIIPVFNAGKYLAETVKSVLSQGYSSWEIVIVNDHSADNSEIIAAEFCQQYPKKISLYLNEGKGAAAARNMGIEKSRGKYLKFLDADDVLFDQDVLLSQLKFIEEGNFDVVYGKEWFYKDNFQESQLIKKRGAAVRPDEPSSFYRNFPITSNFLLRKERLGELKWHTSLRMGDEYFLLFQLFNRGAAFGFQDKEMIKVRQHDSVHRISNAKKEDMAFQTAELAFRMSEDVKALKISDRPYLLEFYKQLLFNSYGAMRSGNYKAAKRVRELLPKNNGLRQTSLELRILFLINSLSPHLAYFLYRGLSFRGRRIN